MVFKRSIKNFTTTTATTCLINCLYINTAQERQLNLFFIRWDLRRSFLIQWQNAVILKIGCKQWDPWWCHSEAFRTALWEESGKCWHSTYCWQFHEKRPVTFSGSLQGARMQIEMWAPKAILMHGTFLRIVLEATYFTL